MGGKGTTLIKRHIPFSEILKYGDKVYFRMKTIQQILSKITAPGSCVIFLVGLSLFSGICLCTGGGRQVPWYLLHNLRCVVGWGWGVCWLWG